MNLLRAASAAASGALLCILLTGCGDSSTAGSGTPENPGTISESAEPEPTDPTEQIDPTDETGGTDQTGDNSRFDGEIFSCQPPAVVKRSGTQLVDEYCKNYRDMWGAMTAMGSDGPLQVQQYLRTQGMLAKKSGTYVIDWPTAKARLDDVAERWKGTPQILLVDAARAAAYLDRADNGELATPK